MKKSLYLFLIILAALLFSSLGSSIQESFDPGQDLSDLGGDIGRGIGDVGRGIGDVVGAGVGAVGAGVGAVGQGLSDLGQDVDNGYIDPLDNIIPYPVVEQEVEPRRVNDNRWILKSQIVPPVCPKCPDITTCRQTPCPACPPCARCPEPAFRCEKVPNYRSRNDMYLPRPVLADFSQFGK